MSKYLLDKFLYSVDRDPGLVERYRSQPQETVEWWEATESGRILNLSEVEPSVPQSFTDAERDALVTQDHVALFELGAHPFLTLTLFIAMFERDYEEPLGYQLAYAAAMSHLELPYPEITT